MTSVGKRIMLARKEAGMNQMDLAQKVSVSMSTLVRWEADKYPPTTDDLKAICAATGKTMHYFIDDPIEAAVAAQGTPILSISTVREEISTYFTEHKQELIDELKAYGIAPLDRFVTVPLLGKAPCGDLAEAVEEKIGEVVIPRRPGMVEGEMFAIVAQGTSMEPLIMDGDTLIVVKNATCNPGDIVLACKGSKVTVKRLGQDGMLEPKNKTHTPIAPDRTSKIIGKVIKVVRDL